MTPIDDKKLDAAFGAAQDAGPPPSEALLNAIMQDADAVLAQRAQAAPGARLARPGLWAQILETLGGWPSAGGLVAATLAGVWIGVAPPDVLANAGAGLWGEAIELPLLADDMFAGLESAL